MPMFEVKTVSDFGSTVLLEQQEWPDWLLARQLEWELDPLQACRHGDPVVWTRVCLLHDDQPTPHARR